MFFLRHPLVLALRAWVELLAFSIPRSLTQYTLHLMSFVPTSCTQLEFHPKSASAWLVQIFSVTFPTADVCSYCSMHVNALHVLLRTPC